MTLIDLLTVEWAIIPEKLTEIKTIIETHIRGEKLNLKDIESKIMSFDSPVGTKYAVEDGIQIINIHGVLTKRASAFERIFFGAESTQFLKDDYLAGVDDPDVKGIVMFIDSPGGTVDGIMDFAQAIYQNRGKKPVYAVTDGTIASAAYWIASACDAIFITSGSDQVGSIGVVATHVSYQKALETQGIEVNEIYAGKYKRMVSDSKNLSPEGRALIQEKVDYIYSLFVDDVARFRGVPVEKVLSEMADGKIFIGKQAVDAGLVDGVSSIHDVKAKILKENEPNMDITREFLASDHKEIYEAIKKEGREEANNQNKVEIDLIKENAKKAETDRVRAVKAQLVPGFESLIEEMMLDGTTTGEQAAVMVIAAQKERLGKMQNDIYGGGVEPVVSLDPVVPEKPVENTEMTDQQIEKSWSKDEALQKEFDGNFDNYKAFVKNKKNIKILRGQK